MELLTFIKVVYATTGSIYFIQTPKVKMLVVVEIEGMVVMVRAECLKRTSEKVIFIIVKISIIIY